MKELKKEEIKKFQINLLKVFTKFCDENNLEYFLGYGTLLGAVRHEGYIPWDDDIDIIMPRPDYEKFIKNYNNFIEGYTIYTFDNNFQYPFPFAKISDNKTILIEDSEIKIDDLGINIDIFPLDGISSSKNKQDKIINRIKIKRKLLELKLINFNSRRAIYKNIIIFLGKILIKIFNYKIIVKKIHNEAIFYDYYKSKYVGCLVWNYGKKEIVLKENFENKIKIKFENENYYAPIGYKNLLNSLYGDYMKLPPIEMRETHHSFKAFLK